MQRFSYCQCECSFKVSQPPKSQFNPCLLFTITPTIIGRRSVCTEATNWGGKDTLQWLQRNSNYALKRRNTLTHRHTLPTGCSHNQTALLAITEDFFRECQTHMQSCFHSAQIRKDNVQGKHASFVGFSLHNRNQELRELLQQKHSVTAQKTNYAAMVSAFGGKCFL